MVWWFLSPTRPATAARKPTSRTGRLVKYYDQHGRKRFVPKDEWRRDILPRQIERAGNDPERLHRLVLSALDYQCGEDALPAAERLVRIDRDPRRGAQTYARALIAAKRVDQAEKVLLDYLGGHGGDGAVLTTLARVYEARGDAQRAEELLWQALTHDPNHAEAVEWWAKLHLDGLTRVAALPGAWRPHLLLGRCALTSGNAAMASESYQRVLDVAADNPEALRRIAEDLVKANQHRMVLDLVYPAYDPNRHGPWTGLSVLQACTECKDIVAGKMVLHALFMRYRHELRDHLQTYANRFLTLLDEPEREAPQAAADVAELNAEPVELRMLPIERPLWWGFLRSPEWLRPQRREEAPVVAFATFAHVGEDTARTWARALPLALAESFAFRAEAESVALVALGADGAAVDVAEPWKDEEAFGFAQRDQRFADYVVTGQVIEGGGHCHLAATIYDAAHRVKLVSFERRGSASAIGAMLRGLEAEIAQRLGIALGDDALGVYESTHPRALPDYLAAQDALLRLHLAANGEAPLPKLLDRCAALEACERLATAEGATALHRLLLLAGVAGDAAVGSQLYREHHDAALALVEEDLDEGSPFFRASPLMLWLFDQQRDFRVRRDELLATAQDPHYREWLERIGQDAAQFVVIGDDL